MRGLSSFRKWKCDRGGPKEELQAKSTVSDRARGESLQRETEGSLRQTELGGRAFERKTKRASGKKYRNGSGLFSVRPSPHSQSLVHSISCIDS